MTAKPRDPGGRLHQLADHLPDADRATPRFVEAFVSQRDPFLASLRAAPDEDEELTGEELRAIREGAADIKAGRVHSSEEIAREFGL